VAARTPIGHYVCLLRSDSRSTTVPPRPTREALITRLRDEVARSDYWTDRASFEKWKGDVVAILETAGDPWRYRFEHPVIDQTTYPTRAQATERERFQQEVHAHVASLQVIITQLEAVNEVKAKPGPYSTSTPFYFTSTALRIWVLVLMSTGLAVVMVLIQSKAP
jgi:hypothetical protein